MVARNIDRRQELHQSKRNLKKSVSLTILLCLVIIFFYVLSGRTYGWGRNAINVQDFNAARFWFYIAAHRGDGRAQNNLAGLYAEGLGGKKSVTLAAYWFKKAASQGVKEAQFNLSNLHEEGAGVPRDTRAAVALLESAAASGDITAMFNLGVLYATGRDDLPRNLSLAVQWYGRAADRGDASAQYNLAGMYAQGTGVQKNFFETRRWLAEAAKQNHAKAWMDLGTLQAEGVPDQKDLALGVKSMRRAQDIDQSLSSEVTRRIQLICGREEYHVAVAAGCLLL